MAGKAQKAGSSKKPQSERKKLSRARCRASAASRHEQLERQQELRHQANLRRDHEPTPWQQACQQRTERRRMTCGKCRVLFENGADVCPQCGGTLNLRTAWEKKQ